jgi:hypothetical protein
MRTFTWNVARFSIAVVGSLLALAPAVQEVAAQIPGKVT